MPVIVKTRPVYIPLFWTLAYLQASMVAVRLVLRMS